MAPFKQTNDFSRTSHQRLASPFLHFLNRGSNAHASVFTTGVLDLTGSGRISYQHFLKRNVNKSLLKLTLSSNFRSIS
jgi:hypothetical protein